MKTDRGRGEKGEDVIFKPLSAISIFHIFTNCKFNLFS